VRRIESYLRDLESERGSYMNRCRGIREELKTVYEDAKNDGIPREELKCAINTAQLQRKINRMAAELEADARQNYEDIIMVIEGLDNLPLGIAAIEREDRSKPKRQRRQPQPSPALDRLTAEGLESALN
jgi:hypothetical protein